jgi:hypothetical protein
MDIKGTSEQSAFYHSQLKKKFSDGFGYVIRMAVFASPGVREIGTISVSIGTDYRSETQCAFNPVR